MARKMLKSDDGLSLLHRTLGLTIEMTNHTLNNSSK